MNENKKICLITPDRNDRPEFLKHCIWQMERQTLRAGAHFIISDPCINGVVDIVPRIKKGIVLAKEMGFEYCFIIENDDFYPDDYIERMSEYFDRGTAMVGIAETTIYSLQYNSYRMSQHPGRSSLFCTAFKISELDNYTWPDDTLLYFDMHLWKHQCKKEFATLQHPPIGIKHGIGFCPGNFHNGVSNGAPMKRFVDDCNHEWLRSRVRKESFEFYQKFKP